MTDETAAGAPQDANGLPSSGARMRILAQYVRDLSFENPRAPESLRVEGKPAIDLGVEMNAQGRADGLFEVDLRLSVKASQVVDDKDVALFQVELVYGGLFEIRDVAPNDMEAMLLTECPRYLFPYARQIIATATADGGFYPPFQLEPLDFTAIYQQRRAQQDQPPMGQA